MAQNSQNVKLVDAAGTNRGKINAGGDQVVSLTNPNVSAAGIFASINPYGGLRVSTEPSLVFFDPFDGTTIDTTVRWNTGGSPSTQVPTQTSGAVSVALTVGTNQASSSSLTSQPSFVSPGLGFGIIASTVVLEASPSVTNVHRFWGKGQTTTYAYATPVTDGAGFEVDGATGALQCVIYIAGTRYVINSSVAANVSSSIAGAGGSGTALPTGGSGSNYGSLLTWRGGQHRYAVFIRSDVMYWFIEGQDLPVAAVSYVTPSVQTLPLRFAAITNSTATSSAFTFLVGAAGVSDSTAGNLTISDGTYPHRKASVGAYGGLSVKGASDPSISFGFAASATGSGPSVYVAEAGNATFVVKNSVANSAWTGAPVIVFEQSDDAVSWAPLTVSSTLAGGTAFVGTVPLPPGVANVELMFDAALEGVTFVRWRLTTGTTANGIMIIAYTGGLLTEPTVSVQNLFVPPASTTAGATAATGLAVAVTSGTPATTGQYVYVTSIQVTAFAAATITGGPGPMVVATSNIGGVSLTFGSAKAIGTTETQFVSFPVPVRGTVAGVAAGISAPAVTNVIWRVNLSSYTSY